MSKNSPAARALGLGLALLAWGAPAQAASTLGVFPESFEVFHKLLADPREIQISAAYYRLGGEDSADVSLGHSWGMARWHDKPGLWVWQWDIEAMAYSRFKLSGTVNEFQTVDFFGNLPLEVRRGQFSGKFMVFHTSSHLGDDYIRRTGDLGSRYSNDGLKALLSVEPCDYFRAYGGASQILHAIPGPDRTGVQGGVELMSADMGWWKDYPARLYVAEDLKSEQSVRWNTDSRTVAGLKVGFKGTVRAMRLYVGYFTGHSPYGQFFLQREHYADIGIALDL